MLVVVRSNRGRKRAALWSMKAPREEVMSTLGVLCR